MDTAQLKRVLATDDRVREVFRDVLPRNHVPSPRTLSPDGSPVGYILNTDPCQQPGEHWVCLYIDSNGRGEYFDSYGLPPLHPDVTRALDQGTQTWTWNTRRLQSLDTAVCGQYTVFYALHRVRGYTMADIVHLFPRDNTPEDNDTLVYDFVYRHFLVVAPYWATSL